MTIQGNKIKFSKVIVTMMYCQGVQQIEEKFFDNFKIVANYKITGGKLYLSAGNKILLEFEAKK